MPALIPTEFSGNAFTGSPLPRLIALIGLLFLTPLLPANAQGTGCVPSPAGAFKTHASVRIAATRGIDRPAAFSLAADLPPIGNQGRTGSCVGWSTAYYCYSTSVARQRKLTPEQRVDPRFLFSPSFIWHQFNKGDKENGMHIFEAFDVLAKQGCGTLADMPWDEKEILSQPEESVRKHALRYKARQTVSLFRGKINGDPADPERLKNWLWETKQPFVIGIPVYADFFKASHDPDFVYRLTEDKGKFEGYHGVCIVGYDSDKHAFLMVNSWTDKWANKGLIWLDEAFITEGAMEGWGQRPGGPIVRSDKPVQIRPSIVLEPATK